MSFIKDGLFGSDRRYALRSFWLSYKNCCVLVVSLVLLSFFSWALWSNYHAQQGIEAANLYALLTREQDKGHTEHLADIVHRLQTKHPQHFFSVLASFRMARFEFEHAHFEQAAQCLRWVLAHGSQPWVDLARIRLANVLIDLHRYDEVISLVERQGTGYFAARFWMVAGDAAFMKEDWHQAALFYKKAQDLLARPCDDSAFESVDQSIRQALAERVMAVRSAP